LEIDHVGGDPAKVAPLATAGGPPPLDATLGAGAASTSFVEQNGVIPERKRAATFLQAANLTPLIHFVTVNP